jgi:hypothetical protein
MAKTCEEIYIERIENGIRSIKLGNKAPDEVNLHDTFVKLKKLNPFMYDDLQDKHIKIVSAYNNNPKNKKRK